MADWYRAKFSDARGRTLLNAYIQTFLLVFFLLLLAFEPTWLSVALLVLASVATEAAWFDWFRRQRAT